MLPFTVQPLPLGLRMRNLIAALILLPLGSSVALADHFTNGAQIADACYGDMSFVQGYVTGVIDRGIYDVMVLDVFAQSEMSKKGYDDLASMTVRQWCAPDKTILAAYLDTVCKFAKAHPEERQKGGSIIVQMAFAEKWPCK